MNQEESEHNEVDGMKKGADSTGEVMHIVEISNLVELRATERANLRSKGQRSRSMGTKM